MLFNALNKMILDLKTLFTKIIYSINLILFTGSCLAQDNRPLQQELFNSSISSNENEESFPRDAIVAVIARAYEFGSGKTQFCSPEIALFNLNNQGVRIVVFTAAYYQTINGVKRQVGQTHGRYSIEPNDITTRGFFQLDTDNCKGITAYGRVTVCIMRDGTDCVHKVKFSDSGRIPLFPHQSKRKN
jgi:hypothetical protein